MKLTVLILVAILILFSSQITLAEEQIREHVSGWELMTDEEFATHRDKMRSLETREERAAYRKEHHEKMLERAKDKGVDLSDCPRRGRGPGVK